MVNRERENLTVLLRRFMDGTAAQGAYEDIQAGERHLEARPAPEPDARVVAGIKAQMVARARRRHRVVRLIRGSLATAAAVIVLALIGLPGPDSGSRSGVSFASIIPAAIWESQDLTTDDLDIVYFTAEIRHIEAQMQALEADKPEVRGTNAVEELEMELLQIETEFWKG